MIWPEGVVGLPPATFDAYNALAVVALVLLIRLAWQHSKLAHIPTVGGTSLPILSYIGSLHFIRNSRRVLQEGYTKHRGRMFKVAMLDRYLVVVTGPELIEELRSMPEAQFSLHESLCQIFEMDYTLGPSIRTDPYHAHLLHSQLTKHLDKMFPTLNEEITAALNEYLDVSETGWKGLPALDIIRKIVCRTTNRAIIGLPICRDEDYLDLQLQFATDVTKSRIKLNLLPRWLKPFAGRFLTTVPARVAQCLDHIEPIIEERKQSMAEHGLNFPDKPDDMLQWFMDASFTHPERFSNRELAIRVLVLNFASIHTTANSLTHALYHLAVNPACCEIIRSEVQAVIQSSGWTKAAVSKMHRLDSFLKESTRFSTLNGLSITRIAMRSHTFRDGTTIPAGTFLGCPTTAVHADEGNYQDAYQFEPFRFVQEDTEKGKQPVQFASTNPSYIPFGHGKSACPGRFFASVEMKTIMAHIILNYDLEIPGGLRPSDRLLGITNFPGPAETLFRRRRVTE